MMKIYSYQVYQIHTPLVNKAVSMMATHDQVTDTLLQRHTPVPDTMTMCCQASEMSAQKRGSSVREEARQNQHYYTNTCKL